MYDPQDAHYFRQFLTPEKLARFARVAAQRTRSLTVVLENLYHSHNAAACLRSCEAFGVQDVHIIEESREFERHRTIDLGAQQWLTVAQYSGRDSADPTGECLQTLRQNGYRLIATVPSSEAATLDRLALDSPIALLFGGERDGLSQRLLSEADEHVVIPMLGFTESLNVSVAAAICLQQLAERLRRERTDWQLSEIEQAALIEEWICVAARHQLPRVYEQRMRERRREAKRQSR